MATIMIRNLDETTKANLRLQAARHRISMEEEARLLLRKALNPAVPSEGLGIRLQRRFGAFGGVELQSSPLSDLPLPDFTEGDVHFAHLVTERCRIGRPITPQDAQIAAIALANDIPLATRNTDDFKAIPGLALVDPWNDR